MLRARTNFARSDYSETGIEVRIEERAYPTEQGEFVTILAVRYQVLPFRFQHVAHCRSSKVRYGTVDRQTVEKYIFGLGSYEYRVRIVEDTVDCLTYK